MKTQEFINKLHQNPNKELLFEYNKGKFAGANYHVTEVKNVSYETVDCGGNTNSWKETHLQLWENPLEIGKKDYLTTDKVVQILNRVNSISPLWLETEIKVEYGNREFHTSVLRIRRVKEKDNKVIVTLRVEKTTCKASDTCGVQPEEEVETCCENSGCC